MKRKVAVDFFADLICPWCYVGWAALKAGARISPGVQVGVQWRNYLLHPDTPHDGYDRKDYFKGRYEPEKLAQIHTALIAAAEAAEITLDLAAPTRMPNTLDAHRLIRWAAGQGQAEAAIDALFAAYWIDGRDIGQPSVLVELAQDAGLDATIVGDLLATEADRDAIAALHNDAIRIGITGVPVAVLNRQAVLMGAETPQNYAAAIDKVAA